MREIRTRLQHARDAGYRLHSGLLRRSSSASNPCMQQRTAKLETGRDVLCCEVHAGCGLVGGMGAWLVGGAGNRTSGKPGRPPKTTNYTKLLGAPCMCQPGHGEQSAQCTLDMREPTVLYPLTLTALLQHVLATQSDTKLTTLILCCSRDDFLQSLLTWTDEGLDGAEASSGLEQFLTPTLHNLATARHVKVAFCASLHALLAYLAVYRGAGASALVEQRIVLVGPLALHAGTASFSAQGLSRTFASAVETALKVGASLVMAECLGMQRKRHEEADEVDMAIREDQDVTGDQVMEEADPWEQEVPILNVSARRYGSNSERAWAGRTVKAKRIAARWFHFQKMDAP